MFNGRETQYSSEIIQSTGFWGDINVGEFQRARAIPLQISLALTKSALVYAMQSIDIDLLEVAEAHIAKGFTHVSELQSPQIDGENREQSLYKKAVFARAKHDLLPEFATISARELHEKRDITKERKELLSEAVMAIRALKGKRRGGVHLL